MSSGGGLVHGNPVTACGELRSARNETGKRGEPGSLVHANAMLRSALSVALAAVAGLGEHARRISECEGRLDGYDAALALLNSDPAGRVRHLHRVGRSASG